MRNCCSFGQKKARRKGTTWKTYA